MLSCRMTIRRYNIIYMRYTYYLPTYQQVPIHGRILVEEKKNDKIVVIIIGSTRRVKIMICASD